MATSIGLVAIGGFFGAISRFGFSNWFRRIFPSQIPLATLIINLSGSFLLGLMIGANLENSLRMLFGTGFMGAFTTFSTFKLENAQFLAKKKWKILLLYMGMSYTFGILLAYIGVKLGSTI